MMMRRRGRLAGFIGGAVVLAVVCDAPFAQEELRLELFRPRLEVTTEGVPESDFEDFAGDLRQRRFSFNLNVPLGRTSIHPGGGILGHQFFAQVRLSSSPIELSLPPAEIERTLYSGAVRVAGLMASRNGHLYLVSLGASFAEDEETIDDIDPRFSAFFVGSYVKSEDLTWLYGGAVTFEYGERLVVPGFGLIWRFSPKWRLFTILPFTVRTTYTASEKTRVHLLMEVAGDRHRFDNAGLFPGQPQTVFYRTVGVRLGAEWEHRPNRDHAFIVQGGVLGGRDLDFSADRDENDFLSTGIDPAGYLKLGWRFTFGKSILDELQDGGP